MPNFFFDEATRRRVEHRIRAMLTKLRERKREDTSK